MATASDVLPTRLPLMVEPPIAVNDVHGRISATHVRRVVSPRSVHDVAEAMDFAARHDLPVSVCGHRHAMGGQPFATNGLLIDMRTMSGVRSLDRERGIIDVRAGTDWPALLGWLGEYSPGEGWTFRQKQTGADHLTLGGALASNIHGRGLSMRPFVDDIESFTMVDPAGEVRECSRAHERGLFSLAIGGYGLFGIVTSMRMRLVRRRVMRREVAIIDIEDLLPSFQHRISEGFTYGDFQFAIDETADTFLRRGVFSCYRPVEAIQPSSEHDLSLAQWHELVYLAHADRARAFEVYADHYRQTDGCTYWSDQAQMSPYTTEYGSWLDARLGSINRTSDVITEIYVPREELVAFMADAARELRAMRASVIYGTIRLIEREDETLLAWARQPWACIIFNVHTRHTQMGLYHAQRIFRRLIDLGMRRGGSYYLTYHRWATRQQTLACHPAMPRFLALKRELDPMNRLCTDWYRHHRAMLDAEG